MMSQGDSLMARKLENARLRQGKTEFAPASTAPPADGLPLQEGAPLSSLPVHEKRFAGSYFETRTVREYPTVKMTPETQTESKPKPWNDPNYLPTLIARCDAKDKEKKAEKRMLLQNNREMLRKTLRVKQAQRLQLEADSQSPSKSMLFAQYGITANEPQPIFRDPDLAHTFRASANHGHFQQLMAHRDLERSKLAARRAARENLERTVTPNKFAPSSQKAAIPSSAPASAKACEENDLKAIGEVDVVFYERQQECREARLGGRRTKPSFDLSLDHRQLTKSAFTFPIYN